TTTSMGRLTLNVLLSFAQFEREVTGERIRDKIAASKRKGLWMGGTVPLGYDLDDRRLVINQAEAPVVRQIYQRYLELGSVRLLVLRGKRDFSSVEEYQGWVREIIKREHNARLGDKLAEERQHLRPLPAVALPAYTALTVKVRRWSTIRVLNQTYSVPARLIG